MDFSYLESFVAGEMSIAFEVLALFRSQAQVWAPGLVESNPDWRAVAHTVKGAARGVGANVLGDACHAAEFGQPSDLAAVHAALAEAVADMAAYMAQKGAA